MCIRVTERYAACACIYYVHGIDQCGAANVAGHVVQERTVLVGYACQAHTASAMRANAGTNDYMRSAAAYPTGGSGRLGVLPDWRGSSSTGRSGSSGSGYYYSSR